MMNEDSRISYILAIFLATISLLWYIISDIFLKINSSLYIETQHWIIAELFISWALFFLLLIFSLYLFFIGLYFTDNSYLRVLSKNPNKIFTLGFEFSFIIIPMAIILIFSFTNLIIFFILFLIYSVSFITILQKIISNSPNKKNLFILLMLISLSFFPFIGVFQFATADINIRFDKNYYYINDYAIITIDKSGITYPYVSEITINNQIVNRENIRDFFTSDEGTKEVVIFNISDRQKYLVFSNNYNIMEVNVNYSIPFLWKNFNRNKFANFIIINETNSCFI